MNLMIALSHIAMVLAKSCICCTR